jgi:hypothetical protein
VLGIAGLVAGGNLVHVPVCEGRRAPRPHATELKQPTKGAVPGAAVRAERVGRGDSAGLTAFQEHARELIRAPDLLGIDLTKFPSRARASPGAPAIERSPRLVIELHQQRRCLQARVLHDFRLRQVS